MFSTVRELLAYLRKESIAAVDLKFTSLMGRLHHVTLPAAKLDESPWEEGVGFDGSNMPGFKSIEAGDMVIVPDVTTAFLDPFFDVPTVSMICDVAEAGTMAPFPRDPRGILRHAERLLADSGVADDCRFGPEFEFFLLDQAEFANDTCRTMATLSCREGRFPGCDDDRSPTSLAPKGGYHAAPPQDAFFNVRNEMSLRLQEAGVDVRYHHHEVGSVGQQEIEVHLAGPVRSGDVCAMVKYFVKMVAHRHGLIATFMPKPFFGEAGSGMHFHQHLFLGGRPLFWDADGYAGLSRLGLAYVAGLLKHAPALLGLTNPSTNSYRRLIPGYEAPVNAFFSLANRSAAVRIPKYANAPDTKRIEFRTPDATCNPYLAMAAQLLAGLDGIRANLDPTAEGLGPYDTNVFEMSEAERRAKIKPLPGTLDEALDALATDHAFLTRDKVFTELLVEDWVRIKRQSECDAVRKRPHPLEFELHLDC
jgi:glutamine synthetase